MRVMKFISVAAVVLSIAAFGVAQQPATQTSTTLRHVPITDTPASSGKDMFNGYCAVCHGKDAKGGGPAASALKSSPTDLTTLAQKNGGKYPAPHVAAVLRGEAMTPSHGSQDMPVWGTLFSSLSQGHEDVVHQRIANLVTYIESLQVK
jgi:mono/diheme cytochrome c family protein